MKKLVKSREKYKIINEIKKLENQVLTQISVAKIMKQFEVNEKNSKVNKDLEMAKVS
jgi:hypothetical protein